MLKKLRLDLQWLLILNQLKMVNSLFLQMDFSEKPLSLMLFLAPKQSKLMFSKIQLH
uniref:Uncharacterized protein n=1 Tax=Rhizophora mucronata TaxID=61149 RepID=A0A2P2PPQ2_RHIMU